MSWFDSTARHVMVRRAANDMYGKCMIINYLKIAQNFVRLLSRKNRDKLFLAMTREGSPQLDSALASSSIPSLKKRGECVAYLILQCHFQQRLCAANCLLTMTGMLFGFTLFSISWFDRLIKEVVRFRRLNEKTFPRLCPSLIMRCRFNELVSISCRYSGLHDVYDGHGASKGLYIMMVLYLFGEQAEVFSQQDQCSFAVREL